MNPKTAHSAGGIMTNTHHAQPQSRTEMLVRKPASDVFEALVNPDITSQFWFTKGSGRLAPDAQVRWDWEMYDVSTQVRVIEFEPDRRLVVEWEGYSGPTTVHWTLMPQVDDTTFVRITEQGFTGDTDDVVHYVSDSTQGFTWMLAGLKAFLEHGLHLNLTADAHPRNVIAN
jgi:uncharacterized protein YndB with AHSA1/START domain